MTDIKITHNANEREKIQAAYSTASGCYHNTRMGDYQRASARHLLVDLNPVPAKGDKVLDLGCGTGIGLFVLNELYPFLGKLVGFDVSSEMLSNASQEAQNLNHSFSWVQGDAHHLPFPDGFFNLVISHNAFHWMTNRPQVLSELKRILEPGGRVALLFEGAGARENMMAVRRKVLSQHGLTPPSGFGSKAENSTAWNSISSVEQLVEEAGFEVVDAWARESYQYIPVNVISQQFSSTAAYWQAGLDQADIDKILEELKEELSELATPRGFREILYPVNIIARKPIAS